MASNPFEINLVVFENYICSFYIDFRFLFVMFPRLCQNLCLCTIFRWLWTIRGWDTGVYPFSKCWRPLLWIFVIRHLITWPASYESDSASWLQISSYWDNMQLSYSQKVIFNAASIHHFEFVNFWFCFVFSVAWGKICVCILNFVQFGRFASEIWRYNDYHNGGHPPCWIFEIGHFHHLTVVCVRLCLRAPNFVLIGHEWPKL